jgi:pimeloyl-ACP methyl ester carboxylesterase
MKKLLFFAFLYANVASAQTTPAPAKNIVLVHGAYADGSGWEAVYNILSHKGYNVTIVQNPLTSLEDDVAAVNRILDKQDGPTVLVGHSWGGTVITEAGNSPKVVSLVYVAAFQPDAGESTLTLVTSAPTAPENGIRQPDAAGFSYYDKAKFHAGFCADLPKEKADFMFASQGPLAGKAFVATISQPAWKTKPSWAIVATADKSINPEIERRMYKRSNSIVTELNGSHVIFISKPKEVAGVIEAAAKGVKKS